MEVHEHGGLNILCSTCFGCVAVLDLIVCTNDVTKLHLGSFRTAKTFEHWIQYALLELFEKLNATSLGFTYVLLYPLGQGGVSFFLIELKVLPFCLDFLLLFNMEN